MRVEYAQKPPMYSLTHLPHSKCEVVLRENIAEATRTVYEGEEPREETYYTADEYCITVAERSGLEEAVAADTAGWTEAAKAEEITAVAAQVRERRNKLLAETDWTQTIDAPVTAESLAEVRAYRQALRDITSREDFPYITEWPAAPAIIKGDPDPVDEAFDVLTGGEENA